jgi:transposase-like protein
MARQDEMLTLVEAWRRSGKSRIAFAREAGIPISTLQRWIRRAEQPAPQQTERATADAVVETPPSFVEIAHE